MALHWPTFFTRLGSAIVFAAVMMAGLLWNEWALLALVSIIMVLCLREYFRIIQTLFPDAVWPSWVPFIVVVYGLVLLWVPRILCAIKDIRPAIGQQQYLPSLL